MFHAANVLPVFIPNIEAQHSQMLLQVLTLLQLLLPEIAAHHCRSQLASLAARRAEWPLNPLTPELGSPETL